MSLITEIQNSEAYLKDAYQALAANGAPLPEKCNMANLAGCIASSSGSYNGYFTVFKFNNGMLATSKEAWESSPSRHNPAGQFAIACGSGAAAYEVELPYQSLSSTWVWDKKNFAKLDILECYLDFENNTDDNSYLLGSSSNSPLAKSFAYLYKATIKNTSSLGNYVFAWSFDNTKECQITLDRNLVSIGSNFMHGSNFNGILELPSSLTKVGVAFSYQCAHLKGLYIPEGLVPPTDNSSLSVTSRNAPAYINGVVLSGPGAKAWKEALPDMTGRPYRKLIIDPEWQ